MSATREGLEPPKDEEERKKQEEREKKNKPRTFKILCQFMKDMLEKPVVSNHSVPIHAVFLQRAWLDSKQGKNHEAQALRDS